MSLATKTDETPMLEGAARSEALWRESHAKGHANGVDSLDWLGPNQHKVAETRDAAHNRVGEKHTIELEMSGGLGNARGQGGTHNKQHSTTHYIDPVLTFSCTNDYDPIDWSPWPHLAEPYRNAVLKADSEVGDVEKDVFMWSLPEEGGAVYEGRYGKSD